jgi:hypothetical protein
MRAFPEGASVDGGLPMISLSDEQSSAVWRAAMPLVPADRPAFLKEVTQALSSLPMLGDGVVARTCAVIQRRYLNPSDLDRERHSGKYR